MKFRLPFSACRFPAYAVLVMMFHAYAVQAQTRGAQLLQQQKPAFPETMNKAMRQGNVLLIGRIDTSGRVRDVKAVGSTHPDFVAPAVAAVQLWQFRPALSNGKPIEIAVNIGMRFRLDSKQRGQISSPILGDLAVFPADASGKQAAPEGFPIRPGIDPKLRVEPVLDLSPAPAARTLHLRAEAVSPSGRRVTVFDRSVAVGAGATEAALPFSAPVGADWQDGIWLIHFIADGSDVGGGQAWVARDPSKFDFAAALRRLTP